ncbi:DUF488 domain-containing protein [Tabrizicola sp.]|jgi:uncharacterized protein YeaO (DUF488 family)|uniref:DUF488 domain-containing protein n=1 Tax=Tabrizicola sp. TaxID=2005166 RepID=UPI0035AF02BF
MTDPVPPVPPVPPIPDDPAERIRVKRVYRAARVSDGKRILVDRLWPRGVSKDRARLDRWCKEIAPSDALRRWFHADPQSWAEFEQRYRAELAAEPELVAELAALTATDVVTLLFGSKDEEHNNATVLAEVLQDAVRRGAGRGG